MKSYSQNEVLLEAINCSIKVYWLQHNKQLLLIVLFTVSTYKERVYVAINVTIISGENVCYPFTYNVLI